MSNISRFTVIALGVALFLSAVVFKFTYDHQKSLWEKEFINEAEIANLSLKNILHIDESFLPHILSFYAASQFVDRDEFKAFVTPILESNSFIQALEWIPRVSDDQRVKFENLAKKDGFPDFQITERLEPGGMVQAGSRPEYFPVFYLEPFIGNETAHGFDLASHPTRFKSLTESGDSGKILASKKVLLVQGEKEQLGTLIFAPYYGNSGVPKTIEERREQLKGFILGVYRLEDMFNHAIIPFLPRGMHLSVFEGKEISGQNNIFGRYKIDSLFEVKSALNFSGQYWTVVLQAGANFRNGINTNMPSTSAGATFFLIMLLFIILESNHSKKRKIENEVRRQTQDLSESRTRMKAIVDHAIDALITIDAKGGIESFNPAAERIFGYKPSEVLGQNVKMLMPEPYSSEHDQYLKNYIETGVSKIIGIGREVVGLRKDGTTFPLDLGISEMYLGENRMFTGIVSDITDRKEVEELSLRFGRVIDNSFNEIFIFDAETLRFIQVNQGARKNIGYSMEELRQMTPLDIKPEIDEKDFAKIVLPLVSTEEPVVFFETTHRRKDGTLYDAEIRLQLMHEEHPPVYVAIIEDVTHRKAGEKALRESQAINKAVLENVVDGIITISEEGIVDSFNPAAERLFGYKPSEVLGQNVKMLMLEPYSSEHDQYLKNYIETGVSKIIGIGREVVGLRKDGTTFPLDLGISEMYLGETRMFTGIVRDITERKSNERVRRRAAEILELTKSELENSRKQLQATLDGIAEAIITIDEQGFIRSVNHAVEQLFQYSPSFLVGTNIKIIMPEPYQSEHDQYLKNYIETGVSKIIGIRREAVGLRKDGTTFPLELGISEIYLDETRMFIGSIRDITLQKEAEEKLEEATRKTQLILSSAGEGIFGLDLDGNTTFANSTAERILGYKEGELLGKLQHAMIHHSRPGGTPYHRDDCHIYAALKDGKIHQESNEVFWRKEGTPVPVEYVSTPINENGKVTGAVVTFRDISERKRIERMVNDHTKDLKRANEMLFNSNKELDDFAYIVSHDLKEPLRGIYNYSTFLKEDYFDKLDEDGKSKLDTLERLSKRMEALINSILYFARLGRNKEIFTPVDLNKVLADTLDNMESLIKESNAKVRVAKDFPTIKCSESRIGEVFQNLIANAIKYNDKPQKWVEIGYALNGNNPDNEVESGPEKSRDNHSDTPVFYVKDNGIGILEKHFDSLFRIFKRLNGKDKFSEGTGAGTTIVKKIIEQHHGRIWLESKVGEGTTFYFTLGGKNRNETNQPKAFNSYS